VEEFTSFTTASPSFAFVVAEAADDDDEEGRRRIAWRTQYSSVRVMMRRELLRIPAFWYLLLR
jgi:hypothetical protein